MSESQIIENIQVSSKNSYVIEDKNDEAFDLLMGLPPAINSLTSVIPCGCKNLQRRKKEFEENFRKIEYQKALIRLINSLEKIKEFMDDITQLKGLNKYVIATNIEKRFKQLTEEYRPA
ncbi:5850_t:CDS:2 [Cetraspora pellucida]|uniref:5850_t:CDS:1 n=1 Tax=Cetraspora pellucida TaxID=1433469 RepID=A0A9N9PEH9_9GLOM|nr:5850_t:CDS:2 [Cetraspora pellucida]